MTTETAMRASKAWHGKMKAAGITPNRYKDTPRSIVHKVAWLPPADEFLTGVVEMVLLNSWKGEILNNARPETNHLQLTASFLSLTVEPQSSSKLTR